MSADCDLGGGFVCWGKEWVILRGFFFFQGLIMKIVWLEFFFTNEHFLFNDLRTEVGNIEFINIDIDN